MLTAVFEHSNVLSQTIDCIQRWVELSRQHPLVLRVPILFDQTVKE